jgi:hypothetical protein
MEGVAPWQERGTRNKSRLVQQRLLKDEQGCCWTEQPRADQVIKGGKSPLSRTISHGKEQAMETVAVVIPTLNEERSIGTVIDSVPVVDLLQSELETAVYVSRGSTDATRKIATRKGAHIIFDEGNGKAAAIRAAFEENAAVVLLNRTEEPLINLFGFLSERLLKRRYEKHVDARLNSRSIFFTTCSEKRRALPCC